MLLELTPNETITLRFSLIENKVRTEMRIKQTTDKLNASSEIASELINFNVDVSVAILSFFVVDHIINRFIIHFISI